MLPLFHLSFSAYSYNIVLNSINRLAIQRSIVSTPQSFSSTTESNSIQQIRIRLYDLRIKLQIQYVSV